MQKVSGQVKKCVLLKIIKLKKIISKKMKNVEILTFSSLSVTNIRPSKKTKICKGMEKARFTVTKGNQREPNNFN